MLAFLPFQTLWENFTQRVYPVSHSYDQLMSDVIRNGVREDIPSLTSIYNHYIETTAVTFDTSPFKPEERQLWFDRHQPRSRHQLLVLEVDGTIVGYSSSGPLRPKPAYDTSVETTIYLADGFAGRGLGRKLYSRLIHELTNLETPVHRCYGIVTQPNDPSMALHHSLGFRPAAHLNEVGYKFGRYWDAVWMELAL